MAVDLGGQKAPIWRCTSEGCIGLDEIPQMGLVVFDNTMYFVLKKEGIHPDTTLREALANRNIVRLQIGGWLPRMARYVVQTRNANATVSAEMATRETIGI